MQAPFVESNLTSEINKTVEEWLSGRLDPVQQKSIAHYRKELVEELNAIAKKIFGELKNEVQIDAKLRPSKHCVVSDIYHLPPSLADILARKVLQRDFSIQPTLENETNWDSKAFKHVHALGETNLAVGKEFLLRGDKIYQYRFNLIWKTDDLIYLSVHQNFHKATFKPHNLGDVLWEKRKVAPAEDVVDLVFKDTVEKAHKVVLKNFSRFFEACLNANMIEKQQGKISCENLNPDAARTALEFMYKGTITGEHDLEAVHEIYKVADLWDIPSLREWSMDRIFSWVESNVIMKENFRTHFTLAFEFSKPDYRLRVARFIDEAKDWPLLPEELSSSNFDELADIALNNNLESLATHLFRLQRTKKPLAANVTSS